MTNAKIFKSVIIFLAVWHLAFLNFNPDSGNQEQQQINLENIKRISRSCYLIQHEYYDPERIQPMKMLQEAFYELAKEVPEVLPKFSNDNLEFFLGAQKIDIPLQNIHRLYDTLYPLSQAFDFLQKNYQGKIKFEDMEYAAVAGMLTVLDPHSNIMPPKVYDEFKTQTEGAYGGLGIVISLKDNELTVIAPIEDTPAYKSGIAADDKILQINDQSTVNMTLTEAVDLMRGPPKTGITLKIKSKNRDPRDVALVREVIVIKSVQSKLVKMDDKKFGVLRIKGFQEDTYSDVEKELKNLVNESKNELSGLIVDLRNNPGGLLDQAIMVADSFLENGDIVITTGAGNIEEEVAVSKKQKNDILAPIIVLVNEGSASASEIVAGALKNNNRAIVLGQKSFGKGSVQSLFNLREGSSLKLTIAQYLTPGRVSIQAVGILPDIHLYPSIIADKYYDLFEDTHFGEERLDAHLDNAKFIRESKPVYSLTYFKEETETEEPESTYTSNIKENEDFPLQLAMKILAQTTSANKEEMLKSIGSVLDKEASSEDQKVVKALKKKDIDWSQDASVTGTPVLEVQHSFLDENRQPLTHLRAGSKIKMKVAVKNLAGKPAFRVLSTTTALNPLLNNKEFIFGKINPGEEKSAEIDINIPADVINFDETIQLMTYTQDDQDNPKKTLIATKFIEKTGPRFSYAYKIIDGEESGTSGNKNSIPEKGESVILQVTLKNLGPGDSEKTSLNIKNTQGKFVFLKKARENIGVLKANESVTKDLVFDVKNDFDKDDFEMDLFAFDEETKASINDTLKFHLKDPVTAEPAAQVFQVMPEISISQNTKLNHNTISLSGEATDPKMLKDIAIFVKGRKLFYINLQDKPGTKTKQFSANLPLEDGLNSILIQARGDRDLTFQKNLTVVYHEDEKLTAQQP